MIRTFTKVTALFGGCDPEALRHLSRQLEQVLANQQRQEESMATQQEILDRIQREVAESRAETAETLAAIQAAVAYIQGVPALVREAVEAALAAHPGADLTPLTQLADELDQQQGQLDQAQLALNAAITTNQAPTEPSPAPVTEPEPAVEPTPVTEPVEGEGTEPATTGTL